MHLAQVVLDHHLFNRQKWHSRLLHNRQFLIKSNRQSQMFRSYLFNMICIVMCPWCPVAMKAFCMVMAWTWGAYTTSLRIYDNVSEDGCVSSLFYSSIHSSMNPEKCGTALIRQVLKWLLMLLTCSSFFWMQTILFLSQLPFPFLPFSNYSPPSICYCTYCNVRFH